MEQNKPRKIIDNQRSWINRKIPPRLEFILKCFIKLLLALTSVFVLVKTCTIANTANLLQINNAIQIRTNAVLEAEMKSKELEMRVKDSYDKSDDSFNDINIRAEINGDELENAIYALLNTYEFACIQYIENKIDKKAFKLFYSEMINYVRNEYDSYFKRRGSQENYHAINKVYKEWYGNSY